MFSSNKAQSTIEYTVAILLVMSGIILMGPYTIRSINAYFKSWEDSVHDSMKDPLKESTQLPQAQPPVCGNHVQEAGETLQNCCKEFPVRDHDGVCCTAADETVDDSPYDCSRCGDSLCTGTETTQTCCFDCSSCGDEICCTVGGPIDTNTYEDMNPPRPAGIGNDSDCADDCPDPACNYNCTCNNWENCYDCDHDCGDLQEQNECAGCCRSYIVFEGDDAACAQFTHVREPRCRNGAPNGCVYGQCPGGPNNCFRCHAPWHRQDCTLAECRNQEHGCALAAPLCPRTPSEGYETCCDREDSECN